MALRISKNRPSPIAIDFGADAIKLLQLEFGDTHRLIAAGSSVIPCTARTQTTTRQAFLEEQLRSHLRNQAFKGKRAVVSIPAFQTLVHHLDVPGGGTEDLEARASVELQSRLNINPAQCVVRYQHVGHCSRGGKTYQRVLCMAAPRETVMGYVEMAQRAKLEVVGVQAEPMCVVRAFAEAYNRRDDDATRVACHIDIGAAATKVIIAKGFQLVFARVIHAGGDHITRTAAERRECDFLEAREHRLASVAARAEAVALAPIAPASSVQQDRVTATADSRRRAFHDQAPLEHEAYDCIVDEVSLALRYYEDANPQDPVEILVFCGGEAHDLDACRALAQALDLPAQIGDPLVQVERTPSLAGPITLGSSHPEWAVAMGLCFCEGDL